MKVRDKLKHIGHEGESGTRQLSKNPYMRCAKWSQDEVEALSAMI